MQRLILTLAGIALTGITASFAQTKGIKEAPAPKPVGAVPTEAQIAWHKLETYAFVHFGLNTFNDLEWGYGNTPVSTFNPKNLDTDQWVRTFKAAGMKGVLITTKHHDGFCLWPTKTTEYSVKNSPWRDGKGDLVKELSESCKKYGLKFGIYLSPWDRNHPEYGREGYQKAFHEQIRELTTNYGPIFEYWFDGANGGTGWYGGADEARKIDPETYYKYEEAAKILRANNPDIMIFGGTVPTVRWIGNEEGWAGQTNYATYNLKKERHYRENIWGHRNGATWLPGEVDVSIRPGWFYHPRENHQVRSVANITNLYYQSVGRNANFLLNFPIGLDGLVPKTDSINAIAYHKHIQRSFKTNLAKNAKVEAKDTRLGKSYSPKHIVDGNDETYWATTDEANTADIVLRLRKRQRINNIALQEYIRLGQRVEAFSLETRNAKGEWSPIATRDSMTTIGYKRIIRMQAVETDAIRLKVTKSMGPVCLSEVAAYLAPELVDAPRAYRDEQDRLVIVPQSTSHSSNPDYKLRYRIGNGPWRNYTEPIVVPSNHLSVEAEASTDSHKASANYSFGYSAKTYQLVEANDEGRKKLFDGNGYSAVRFDKSVRNFTFKFDKPSKLSSFVYVPNQQRDAEGHIQAYQIYIDDKLVASGEFQNIKANPIATEIKFPQAVVGSTLRLEVKRVLDDRKEITVGDFAIY